VEDLLGRFDGARTTGTLAAIPEPLSDRELTVLRFLPTALSVPQIADELFVSPNTVRTHIKRIYRKLDVGTRKDALDRARELRLIGGRR
jgi:LuxR family maltose regulon positive regulatory protein